MAVSKIVAKDKATKTEEKEYNLKAIFEIHDAIKGLRDYVTTASFIVGANYLKVKPLFADAMLMNKELNRKWVIRDENQKIQYTEEGDYYFDGEALEELNNEWDKYLRETVFKIAFVPMRADQFKTRITQGGRPRLITVEMPSRFTDPLIEHGIYIVPENALTQDPQE